MSFVKRKSAKNWMGVTASLPWLVVCHHKPAVGHIWMKGSMRSCSSTVRHGTRSMKLQTLDLTSAWPVKEGSMAKESTSRIKAAKVDRVYSIPGQSVVTVVASSLPVRSLGTLFVPRDPWSNWRWNHGWTKMTRPFRSLSLRHRPSRDSSWWAATGTPRICLFWWRSSLSRNDCVYTSVAKPVSKYRDCHRQSRDVESTLQVVWKMTIQSAMRWSSNQASFVTASRDSQRVSLGRDQERRLKDYDARRVLERQMSFYHYPRSDQVIGAWMGKRI